MNTHTDQCCEEATPISGFRPGRQQPSHKILLLEPSNHVRDWLAAWLMSSGYQVDKAATVLEARNAVIINQYDLLIIDHNPQNGEELELVDWLHSAPTAAPTPTVVLSGKLNLKELSRNRSLQTQWFQLLKTAAYLRKPFTTGELLTTVSEILATVASWQPQNVIPVPTPAERPQLFQPGEPAKELAAA